MLKYKDITVACVLWVGDFRKREYQPYWVQNLKKMVKNNLSIPYNFVCLSNVDIPGVDVIKLKHNYPGWWSKIELFREDIPGDRFFALDLDLFILKELDSFFEIKSPMVICKGIGENGYNSSVMLFDKWIVKRLYKYFDKKDMEEHRGDQDYIKAMLPHLVFFPDKWINKLRYCLNKKHNQCVPEEETKILLSMPYKNDVAIRKFSNLQEIWG